MEKLTVIDSCMRAEDTRRKERGQSAGRSLGCGRTKRIRRQNSDSCAVLGYELSCGMNIKTGEPSGSKYEIIL